MTDRTSKIAKLSALVFASVAAVALSAGVVTAEPKNDRPAAAARDTGANGAKGAHGRKGGKGHGAGRLFARFDANHDGALQKAEVPAPVWQHISVADANRDASITKAELRQARQDGKLQPPRGHRPGKARRS